MGEDGEEYILQLSKVGREAAVMYGLVPTLLTLLPAAYWFSIRKEAVDSLTKNSIY